MQHTKIFFCIFCRLLEIKQILKKFKEVLPNISLNLKIQKKKKSKQSLWTFVFYPTGSIWIDGHIWLDPKAVKPTRLTRLG